MLENSTFLFGNLGGNMCSKLEVKEYPCIRGLDVFHNEQSMLSESFFCENVGLKLLDREIIVDKHKIAGLYERFMHAVSCDHKEMARKFYPPCVNELSSVNCVTECQIERANFNFQKIKRVECIYRLSRIHWIEPVIEMANKNDNRVKVWRFEKQDKTNRKWQWKWYVRYQEKASDFLIVFREDIIGDEIQLNFRTAYPVYLPGDKKKLEKEYAKSMKDGNIIKKPAFV